MPELPEVETVRRGLLPVMEGQLIARAQVKRAVLTNLHIDLDYQRLKRELPANVDVAYDGWHDRLLLDEALAAV